MFSRSLRRSVACLFCVSVLVAAPAAFAQDEQTGEMDVVRAAEQMVRQGQPDEALAELQSLLAENPEFAPAHFVAGLAYAAKQDAPNAYQSMLKAAEFNPGFGQAHRLASMYAADLGDLDASWAEAIRAHQAGTDMSDAFAGLPPDTAPEDLDAAMAAPRVFVGPIDTETFEEQGDTALAGGANSSASGRTNRGARVIQEVAPDILRWGQEAKRQFSTSRAFGLVQRPEQSQYILIFEVDSIADSTRRRTRGYLRLVDSQSGEDAYRRRVEFADIASLGDLNRDFSRIMDIMEEWAAEQQR